MPLKIVLFGPESTGKTTLCMQLAEHFDTKWLPEYARIYLEHKWNTGNISDEICPESDLKPIVEGQLKQEKNIESNSKFVFLDTNPLETLVYAKYYFGKTYPWLEKIVQQHNYDFYLLTDISVAWQPDILRDRPKNRTEIFDLFLKELQSRQLPFGIVSGIENERFINALALINKQFGNI